MAVVPGSGHSSCFQGWSMRPGWQQLWQTKGCRLARGKALQAECIEHLVAKRMPLACAWSISCPWPCWWSRCSPRPLMLVAQHLYCRSTHGCRTCGQPMAAWREATAETHCNVQAATSEGWPAWQVSTHLPSVHHLLKPFISFLSAIRILVCTTRPRHLACAVLDDNSCRVACHGACLPSMAQHPCPCLDAK